MSKKFFSLIHGDSVHAAPTTKVLAADAFSTLADAHDVMQAVLRDAEQYRTDVTTSCEAIKEQAQRDGFAAGFEEWTDKVVAIENEIKSVSEKVEKVLVSVALKAAKKIVGREIELNPDAIVDIVSNSLKAVSQHKNVIIWCNKKDLEILEKHRPYLREIFESLQVLTIRERNDVTAGGCIIETEGGIINARIEHQWEIMERAFEQLVHAKKPSSTGH